MTDTSNITPRTMSSNVLSALQGVRFIAQHIRDADKDNEVMWFIKKKSYIYEHVSLNWHKSLYRFFLPQEKHVYIKCYNIIFYFSVMDLYVDVAAGLHFIFTFTPSKFYEGNNSAHSSVITFHMRLNTCMADKMMYFPCLMKAPVTWTK